MRKITEESVQAFNEGILFSKSNTQVKTIKGKGKDAIVLSLHGNNIAIKIERDLYITNQGWKTNTTKERLNGLDGVDIHQKKGVWYLNGKEWDGNLVEVKKW